MNNNGTMMQYFEWYCSDDGDFYNRLIKNAECLKDAGITALWLPPACKGASGSSSVGYDIYDLYDLGEFDQKGSIRTKYGTKEQYLSALEACRKVGLDVYADVVLNHKIGADGKENVFAYKCDKNNRNNLISDRQEIEAWTIYDFKARNGVYSDFVWDSNCFDGTDWDDITKSNDIYLFEGRQWECQVDGENGNYDYLKGADIDFDNESVVNELINWGRWYYDTTHIAGFRLDAVKHIKAAFYDKWISAMRQYTGKPLFTVGEYWHRQTGALENYLAETNGQISLFDVPLHFKFYYASTDANNFDLRTIFDDTLTKENSTHSVTFVDNHDTQPEQALCSTIEQWFKPHAYAMILLREAGYPCVFYGDYYGIEHNNIAPMKEWLNVLIKLRYDYAYGLQRDFFY